MEINTLMAISPIDGRYYNKVEDLSNYFSEAALMKYRITVESLGKIYVNNEKILKDIEENHIVIAEAIQTILRREGYPNPYEAVKELTRTNEKLKRSDIVKFIGKLDVPDIIKLELTNITVSSYTGQC